LLAGQVQIQRKSKLNRNARKDACHAEAATRVGGSILQFERRENSAVSPVAQLDGED
jgi:hypothetical protein